MKDGREVWKAEGMMDALKAGHSLWQDGTGCRLHDGMMQIAEGSLGGSFAWENAGCCELDWNAAAIVGPDEPMTFAEAVGDAHRNWIVVCLNTGTMMKLTDEGLMSRARVSDGGFSLMDPDGDEIGGAWCRYSYGMKEEEE